MKAAICLEPFECGVRIAAVWPDGLWCGRPVDMVDKAHALPTSPRAQQQQRDVINRFLAA